MPRPDRGCCCDNSKSPNSGFCCTMDSYTDGRQTYPGCATSYSVKWSNVQLFGAYSSTGSGFATNSGLNTVQGCYDLDWGYSIDNGGVDVVRVLPSVGNDYYIAASEVSGTYGDRCAGMTKNLTGKISTRRCKTTTCGTGSCINNCNLRSGDCAYQSNNCGPICADLMRGCFCEGTGKEINFGGVRLGCEKVGGDTCSTGKVFSVSLSFKTRATLNSSYNDSTAQDDCDNSSDVPCWSGTGDSSAGCFCAPPEPQSPGITYCCKRCGDDGGGGSLNGVVPGAPVMVFKTGTLDLDACPNGQTYTLDDWVPGMTYGTGSVTVT